MSKINSKFPSKNSSEEKMKSAEKKLWEKYKMIDPRLAQGKKYSPGYSWAQIFIHYLRVGREAKWDESQLKEVGKIIVDHVVEAIWNLDQKFISDFSKGLRIERPQESRSRLYVKMLFHLEKIAQLKTTTEIFNFMTKDSEFLELDFNNFATLCRDIGLPVGGKGFRPSTNTK